MDLRLLEDAGAFPLTAREEVSLYRIDSSTMYRSPRSVASGII